MRLGITEKNSLSIYNNEFLHRAGGAPMITRSKAINAFIEKIRSEVADYNIKVTITKSMNVYAKDGTPSCCGIFIPPEDDPRGIGHIRVAAGGQSLSETILSLAHEYIHFRQWRNNEKIYYTDDYFKLERNTERRAISFMKINSLPQKLLNEAMRHSSQYLHDLKTGVR